VERRGGRREKEGRTLWGNRRSGKKREGRREGFEEEECGKNESVGRWRECEDGESRKTGSVGKVKREAGKWGEGEGVEESWRERWV
jgi:hypothetical protein